MRLHLLSLDDVRSVYDLMVEMVEAGELDTPMGEWTRASGEKISAILSSLGEQCGHDPYPSLESKAARLFVAITTRHPLVDGNKRLGVFSMIALLQINGFDVDSTSVELLAIARAIIDASGEQVPDDRIVPIVSDWIAKHLVKR